MSLGAMIAKSRTDARLTVDELAKLTNIPTTLLRDMENDNLSELGYWAGDEDVIEEFLKAIEESK